MKAISLLLILTPLVCRADGKYTERDWHRHIPLAELPVASVQPLAIYTPSEPVVLWPGREYQSSHLVTIGLRNIGTNVVERIEVFMICSHGVMTLQAPDGKTVTRRVPTGFRGAGPREFTGIGPGEETYYAAFPLWGWFNLGTNSPDGAYTFWWQVGTNLSSKVIWRKVGYEAGMR
jgi:hypothetical protein